MLDFLNREIQKLKSSWEIELKTNIKSTLLNSSRNLDKEIDFKKSNSSNRFSFQAKYYSVTTKKVELVDNFNVEGLKNKKEATFLHIFTDKTSAERLKTEKANREYQRLMLSSVAHEFRNPLSSVSGNLDLIQIISQNEKVKEFVKRAKISWKMINSYVEDILDLGRIEGGGFHLNHVEFQFSQIVKETKELFENEAKNRMIEFKFMISKQILNEIAKADKDRIRQVLVNLVSNALKFTNSSVKVDIFDLKKYEVSQNNQILFSVRINFNNIRKKIVKKIKETAIEK